MVSADLDDVKSLEKAFEGAYAVFSVTDYWATMDGEREVRQGKNAADVAVVSRLYFSLDSLGDNLCMATYPSGVTVIGMRSTLGVGILSLQPILHANRAGSSVTILLRFHVSSADDKPQAAGVQHFIWSTLIDVTKSTSAIHFFLLPRSFSIHYPSVPCIVTHCSSLR